MNESSETASDKVMEELNFTDYWKIFLKWRWSIITVFIVVSLLSAVASLLVKKTYTATAVVMPEEFNTSLGFQGASLEAPSIGLGGLFGGTFDLTNRFLAILKSRTLAERVIHHFDLLIKYGAPNIEEAIKTLEKRVDFSVDDEGMIKITVAATTGHLHPPEQELEARDLCARMANYYVDQLDNINAELQTQQARNTRLLIEQLYERNKGALRRIETEAQAHGESYGLFAFEDQVSAAVLAGAELEKEIMLKEAALEAARRIMDPARPEVRSLEIELRELRKKLREMKLGSPTVDSLSIFPRLDQAPQLGIADLRMRREMEAEAILYHYLTQQYEQAKVQEAQNTPTIQVLDRATAPVKKTKPFRALWVIASDLMAMALLVFIILIKEKRVVVHTL